MKIDVSFKVGCKKRPVKKEGLSRIQNVLCSHSTPALSPPVDKVSRTKFHYKGWFVCVCVMQTHTRPKSADNNSCSGEVSGTFSQGVREVDG